MRILKALLVGIFFFYATQAQAVIELRDEGVKQGYIARLDCVGSGVTATAVGILGTLTIDFGAISTDLIPSADNTYDIGESTTPLEWKDLYIDGTAYVDTLSAGMSHDFTVSSLGHLTTNGGITINYSGATDRFIHIGDVVAGFQQRSAAANYSQLSWGVDTTGNNVFIQTNSDGTGSTRPLDIVYDVTTEYTFDDTTFNLYGNTAQTTGGRFYGIGTGYSAFRQRDASGADYSEVSLGMNAGVGGYSYLQTTSGGAGFGTMPLQIWVDAANEYEFDATDFDAKSNNIKTTGNIYNRSDASYNYFGLGEDASIVFDGDSLNITANAVTATDDLELTAEIVKVTGEEHILSSGSFSATGTVAVSGYLPPDIEGTGTSFTTEVKIGDSIEISGNQFTVVEIVSDTNLVVGSEPDLAATGLSGSSGLTMTVYPSAIEAQEPGGTTQLNIATEVPTIMGPYGEYISFPTGEA